MEQQAPKSIKIKQEAHKTIIRYGWDKLIFVIYFLRAVMTSFISILFFVLLFLLISFLLQYLGLPEALTFQISWYAVIASVTLTFSVLMGQALPFLFNYSELEISEDDLHLTHYRFMRKKQETYLPIASIQNIKIEDGSQRLQQKIVIEGRTEQLDLKGLYPENKKINFLQKYIKDKVKI